VNGHAENEEFARLIDALNPWLGVAVIIGGWAHRLYRIHPVAQVIAYAPIGTLDTDVAIPAELRVEGDDLRKRLLANRFEEERLGQDKPPATHYRLRDAETGFYAEFLTPLIGAHEGRDGQPKATKRIECCSTTLGRLKSASTTGFPLPVRSKYALPIRLGSLRTSY
jgi:Nucleotidyltransferase